MITLDNILEQYPQISQDSLPTALQQTEFEFIQENIDLYNEDDTIKQYIDTFIEKLNKVVKNSDSIPDVIESEANSQLPKLAKSSKKVKVPKVKTKKKQETKSHEIVSDEVEFISPEVKFIKRYASLHDKRKEKAQILSLINSLQRNIVEKRIRKSSGYADIIEKIQEELISCYNKMGKSIKIEISPSSLEKYKSIAKSETVSAIVRFMKGVISIQGKKDVQKRANSLYKSYSTAFVDGDISQDDPRYKETVELSQSLLNYLQELTDTIEISDSILHGLQGFLGESVKGLNGLGDCSAKCISSTSLPGMQFSTIGLQGKYRTLIGDPSVGFTAMVFGLPKSGKSTLCIDFAKHLAEHHGKVLYVAIEEGFGYTLKEKFERLHAVHPNLEIAEKIPSNLSNYDFAFIDSVSKAGMTIEDLVKLHKQFPKTAFIFIFHSTKDGKFRGGQGFAHEVDCIIDVADGVAKGNGRFGIGGEINVF